MSNKYDLGCLLTGAVTSTFFTEAFEKTLVTTISMIIATTVSYFWRKYLHKKNREKLKRDRQNENLG